ncbi:MAG: DUF4286 family protein [Gammaproteobacteria bacterium]
MVVYEVNLSIESDIFDDYMGWLTPHVEEMLTFKGFKSARYLSEQRAEENGFRKITVQYVLENMADLDHYLKNHSQRMREDGLRKFPDKFSATRRIFEITKEF